MSKTPKKVTDVGEKCFLYSENRTNNDRLFVFGRSALDTADLIKVSVDVDVNNILTVSIYLFAKTYVMKRLLRLKVTSKSYPWTQLLSFLYSVHISLVM
jgi:hypothetical protein